jgi:hypothetical protein
MPDTSAEAIVPIQLSHHIQFKDISFLENGEIPLDMQHPEGDYSELNRYIERLENILKTHQNEKKYQINLEWSDWQDQYCVCIEGFSLTYFYVKHAFTENSVEHQKGLILPLAKLIDQNEQLFRAHPLIESGRIILQQEIIMEGGDARYTQDFFKPFGDFAVTLDTFEQLFNHVDLFRNDAFFNFFFHQDPIEQKYHIQAMMCTPENFKFIESKPVTIDAKDVNDFFKNGVVMDNYLAQASYSLIESVQCHPDYLKAKAKVDLYHSLDNEPVTAESIAIEKDKKFKL